MMIKLYSSIDEYCSQTGIHNSSAESEHVNTPKKIFLAIHNKHYNKEEDAEKMLLLEALDDLRIKVDMNIPLEPDGSRYPEKWDAVIIRDYRKVDSGKIGWLRSILYRERFGAYSWAHIYGDIVVSYMIKPEIQAEIDMNNQRNAGG